MHTAARWFCLILLLSAASATADGAAPSPRQELLRYVPGDTTLCVLFQGLRDRGNDLAKSPLVAKLVQSPLGKQAAGLNEIQELLKLEKLLEQITGLTTQRLRDDVLGDLVVLAYRTGPPGKQDQEEGLVLVHARDPRALQTLVQQVNKVQKSNGELKALEDRNHRGQPYVRRIEKDRPASFYFLRERILLYSTSEPMLQRAIEQNANLKPEAASAVEQSLNRLNLADAMITFWVDPRAFDSQLEAKLPQMSAEEASALRTFLLYWKALDALALAVQLDADLTLNLGISGRPESLPAPARAFLTRLAEPSRLWAELPEEPLLALACRLDLKALLDAWLEFLPANQRKTILADLQRMLGAPLGKEFVNEVLPALGPDLNLLALPPGREQSFFPNVLLAARVKPTNEVDRSLWEAVHTFATLVVLGHNQKNADKPLVLKRQTLDKLDIRSLVGEQALPPGFQPAYALARGHLVFASSAESLRLLVPRLSEAAAPAPATTGPVPIARVSFKAWREYLQARKVEIAEHIAKADEIRPAEAQARIDAIVQTLEYVDRLEVRHQPAPGRMLLQISLRTTWPLK